MEAKAAALKESRTVISRGWERSHERQFEVGLEMGALYLDRRHCGVLQHKGVVVVRKNWINTKTEMKSPT